MSRGAREQAQNALKRLLPFLVSFIRPVADKMLHALRHAGSIGCAVLAFACMDELIQLGSTDIVEAEAIVHDRFGHLPVRLQQMFCLVQFPRVVDR